MERQVLSNFRVGWMAEDYISKTEIDPAAASNCLDVEFTPRGTIAIRPGTQTKYTGGNNPQFTKIYQWQNLNSSDYTFGFTCTSGSMAACGYTIMTSGGGIALDSLQMGKDGWAPASGDWISAASYNGSAFFTYSGTHSLPLRGTDLSNPAPLSAISLMTYTPSGSKVIESTGNYMFCGNCLDTDDPVTRAGSRVYFNSSGLITSWPASYYLDLEKDDGDKITAMRAFQDKLAVFKLNKMFLIYWVGGKLLWNFQRITSSIGCVGANAVVEFNGVLYWMHTSGVYAFDGNAAPKEISQQIKTVITGLPVSNLNQVQAMAKPDKNQIWFAVPYQGDAATYQSLNTTILVYDIVLNCWSKFGIAATSIGQIRLGSNYRYIDFPSAYSEYSVKAIGEYGSNTQETTLIGKANGSLVEYGTAYTTDDSVQIPAYWTSSWIDFGAPDLNKRVTRVSVWMTKTNAANADFITYSDWDDDTQVHSETFHLSGSTGTLEEERADFTHYARAYKFMISADAASSTQWQIHKIATQYFVKGRTKV